MHQRESWKSESGFSTHATSILPSGLLVAPMTLVPSLNLRPCFCRMRWKFLEISMSMPIPPTWPRNSTAVTLAPRRCHTDPCRMAGQTHVWQVQLSFLKKQSWGRNVADVVDIIMCLWVNQSVVMLTSSTPMTPAPITISSSGTFFRERAPVDDTMVSSSI